MACFVFCLKKFRCLSEKRPVNVRKSLQLDRVEDENKGEEEQRVEYALQGETELGKLG